VKLNPLPCIALVLLLVALTGCKTVRWNLKGTATSEIPPVIEVDHLENRAAPTTGASAPPVVLQLFEDTDLSPYKSGNVREAGASVRLVRPRTVLPPFPAMIVWQIPFGQ
jgi:hypothetical protein